MEILISVIAAVLLIGAAAVFGGALPGGEMLGGRFYQVIAIALAIIISAFLNLPMLYMFRGNSQYSKKQYKKALEYYKKAYKTGRLSPEMTIYYAYIALKEGRTETAEEVFEKLKGGKLSEKQMEMFNTNYALLLWKKGRLDEATELLSSLSSSPTRDGSLGALYLIKARETGDYEAALAFCEEAHEKYEYDKEVMCNIGEAYYLTNRLEEAEKIFEELISLRPSVPAPFYFYGLTLKALGKTDDAEDMFRKALRFRFTSLTPIRRKDVEGELD